MKIYRLALIFLASVTCSGLYGQGFANLETGRGKNAFSEWNWELMIRRTQVNTKYTIDYGGTTFNMKFRFEDYEQGASRWHFENPTLGDMLWVVGRMLNGKELANKSANGAEQAFGSGFFGWHQVTWNVVAQDRLLISPGMSFGDYIFTSKRPGGTVLEPSGYYFHIGPSVMATQMIGDSFWVNVTTRYDLAGRAAGKPAPQPGAEDVKYKNPHFLGLGATINHVGTHLAGTINYTKMIDRGANKDSASRFDISIGFMF
jgi:hypothetical protein